MASTKFHKKYPEAPARSPAMQLSVSQADRIAAIMAGLDAMATDAEARWGVGRLPLLVDLDLRERFYRQARKLDAALTDADLPAIEAEAAKMQNAWAALDRAATAAGAPHLSPDAWEIPMSDGSVVAIVRTSAEAAKLTRENRAMVVWTMQEIANVLEYQQLINKAKAVFPGARVEQVRHKRPKFVEDEIPEWDAGA